MTVAVTASAAQAHLALVIGNGDYHHVAALQNPPNDARLIANTLKSLGFQLIGGTAVLNADRAAMEHAIRDFGRGLRRGEIGLFYYAGHGLQIEKENYLVPIGAEVETAADAKWELINVSYVLDEMRRAHNRLNIVILDACRSNPFGGRVPASDGLMEMLPENGVIMYSAQAGHAAVDGTGKNSPFTAALTAGMLTPGLSVIDAFKRVRFVVRAATEGKQDPYLAVSLIDNFQFRRVAPRRNADRQE